MVRSYLCPPKNERRVRLRARTPPFHGGDTGSNPVRGTKSTLHKQGFLLAVVTLLLTYLFFFLCSLFCQIQEWDITILRELNVHRNRSLDDAFVIITDLAAPLAYSIPFVLLFLSIYRKNKLLKSKSIFIITAMALALLVNATLKHTIDRPRPYVTYSFIEKLSYGSSPSFPSGHTSDAFAMASTLIIAFPRRWLGFVVFVWAMLVGYSRMHLGVHYPSDVLASIVLAYASAWAVWHFGRYKKRWMQETAPA